VQCSIIFNFRVRSLCRKLCQIVGLYLSIIRQSQLTIAFIYTVACRQPFSRRILFCIASSAFDLALLDPLFHLLHTLLWHRPDTVEQRCSMFCAFLVQRSAMKANFWTSEYLAQYIILLVLKTYFRGAINLLRVWLYTDNFSALFKWTVKRTIF